MFQALNQGLPFVLRPWRNRKAEFEPTFVYPPLLCVAWVSLNSRPEAGIGYEVAVYAHEQQKLATCNVATVSHSGSGCGCGQSKVCGN